MKLINYLCTALIVAATDAEAKRGKVRKPGNNGGEEEQEIGTWYCNRGWGGDGRCDATPGVYTFCVSNPSYEPM